MGFSWTFAFDDLSVRKVATQAPTYPGLVQWYKADNAVDRNITTCTRTEAIGPTSAYKTVWWKVDLGGVYNIYSVNILFKNYVGYELRQRGRFAGFSVYISNTGHMDNSSLCYKNIPDLPPLNFTTTCITYGRYVIVYNERLHGVTYPSEYETYHTFMELCEVFVSGCSKPGVYGSNCDIPCPINCRYNTCHILNGTCFGCVPGWIGMSCDTQCADGWHGNNCTPLCSGHCRDNAVCNPVTGHCDGGCAAGWSGYSCSTFCENGRYGYDCVNKCSGNCLNDFPCNKRTGHCDEGCKPGYSNTLCNEPCVHGIYGAGCSYQCSEQCLIKTHCNHIHGTCIGGCKNGYMGKLCNVTCQKGYFGSNCSGVCSANCKTCRHTDGKCSCHAGWMGFNCSTACQAGYYGNNCSGVCSPNCKTCRHTDGKCSCRAGWTGFNCSTACNQSYGEDCRYPCSDHCFNQTSCDRFTGHCLCGCEEGFGGRKCDQDILSGVRSEPSFSEWKFGGPVSVGINVILIFGLFICLWAVYTKRIHVIVKKQPSLKADLYTEAGTSPEDTSHYQELGVYERSNPNGNTTLN